MADLTPRAMAQYDFAVHTGPAGGEVIVVIDRDHGKTVTNDASAVVAAIAEEMGGLGARPMIYRDTSKRYDGLDHDGRRFIGFYPISTTGLLEAIRRVELTRLF